MKINDILIDDYPQIFRESVLLLDGKPYYILGFYKTEAKCLNVGSQVVSKIDFKEIKDITTPNLGYVNFNGSCYYRVRFAYRRFKHGLSKEASNLQYNSRFINGAHELQDKSQIAFCKDIWASPNFQSYLNIYPTIEHILDSFEEPDVYCLAFDRQFAINRSFEILYKGKFVGYYNLGTKSIVFKEEYSNLNLALKKRGFE